MKLEPQHEIIGILQAINDEEHCIKLTFSFTKEISIPPTEIPQEKLYGFLGEKIGIFNNDGNYKFRIIKDKKLKKIPHKRYVQKTV